MFDRRLVLGGLLTSAMVTPALADDDEVITSGMITGPYYPDRLPADRDWDLLRNGGLESGATPLIVEGVVKGVSGPPASPLRDATIELWQCDAVDICIAATRGRWRGTKASRDMARSARTQKGAIASAP
ncbi:hypothetical protein [Brevundimonas sp. NIBR11]|uniref:hypothetical protein n=1 Tax=Brevundimonas sp. NIBR11 TaxID=3015999 RepID=UPI0022EFE8D7|nr:hypothetical protein [Brevundimonas sp. NIBR11]